MDQRVQLDVQSTPSGASMQAIAEHYDVGSDFFRLWLGEGLVYSAARWAIGTGDGEARSLERAQEGKLDYHLDAVRAGPGKFILDVGCGWGAAVSRALRIHGVSRAVGLTLSPDQFAFCQANATPGAEFRLQSYVNHVPANAYDGIISIGAFEHFARPRLTAGEKEEIYANFFALCRRWLKPGGRLSLQTIAWGDVSDDRRDKILPEHVFPESDLPFAHEILRASHRSLEIVDFENRREDYARTLSVWLARLRENRAALVSSAEGRRMFEHHEDYLRQSIIGFRRNRTHLLRLVFRRGH